MAQFTVYKILINSVFPIFFAFYLGAWADLFGRKLLLKLFFVAYIIQASIEVLCAYFLDSKKEWLLLAGVPFTLVGMYILDLIKIDQTFQDKKSSYAQKYSYRHGLPILDSHCTLREILV